MTIREVEYSAVKRFQSAAAKERVSLKPTAKTRWFVLDDIACAGLMDCGSGKFRIKGVYVDKAFRGSGVGTKLTEHLIQSARDLGASQIEAYAHNPAFYSSRGFVEVGRSGYGVSLLRLSVG